MRRLEHGIGSRPLLVLPEGTHVVAGSPEVVVEMTVEFPAGAGGVRAMASKAFDPVRGLTGG